MRFVRLLLRQRLQLRQMTLRAQTIQMQMMPLRLLKAQVAVLAAQRLRRRQAPMPQSSL